MTGCARSRRPRTTSCSMRSPGRSTRSRTRCPGTPPDRPRPPQLCAPHAPYGGRACRAPRSRSERLQTALAQPRAIVLRRFEHHVEGLAVGEDAILLHDDPAVVARAAQFLQALVDVRTARAERTEHAGRP